MKQALKLESKHDLCNDNYGNPRSRSANLSLLSSFSLANSTSSLTFSRALNLFLSSRPNWLQYGPQPPPTMPRSLSNSFSFRWASSVLCGLKLLSCHNADMWGNTCSEPFWTVLGTHFKAKTGARSEQKLSFGERKMTQANNTNTGMENQSQNWSEHPSKSWRHRHRILDDGNSQSHSQYLKSHGT